MIFEKGKYEIGLSEEFDYWLENTEWGEDRLEEIKNLTQEDKDNIVEKVLCDEQLTQEMFNCFEWYLNKYLGGKR